MSNANNNVFAIFVAYVRCNAIITRRRLIKQPANVRGTLLTVIELSEIRRRCVSYCVVGGGKKTGNR